MYHLYFGLTEPAFSIAVNPKYLYMSEQHKEALAHLVYGVQSGGFVLLSGEVGTGKTTIVRCLLQQLPPETKVAFILNPMADVISLLSTICEELNISADKSSVMSIKSLMDSIQAKLLKNHAKGKRSVLLIDEAQLLSVEVLEQIRLLTNLESDTEKLLQIILVGQPEINDLLSQPRLRQLSQRITARFHIQPLSLHETENYIDHRLKIAGKSDNRIIFPKTIIKKIYKFSGGIPRLINILCERALIGAYGQNKIEIDPKIFNRAISEVGGTKSQIQPVSYKKALIGIALSLALLTFFIFALMLLDNKNEDSGNASTNEQAQNTILEKNTTEILSNKPATTSPNNSSFLDQKSKYSYLFSNSAALSALFKYHDVLYDDEKHPCWQTERHKLSCSKEKISTWEELISINRPVILSLLTEEKTMRYVVLVGAGKDDISVLDERNSVVTLRQSEIVQMWNGSVTFVWRKPNGYTRPLSLSDQSPIVQWTAEKFALIDGQAQPITNAEFTKRLETRVKIFQDSTNLTPDGIIGQRTLMKLNERVGLAKTLIDGDNSPNGNR